MTTTTSAANLRTADNLARTQHLGHFLRIDGYDQNLDGSFTRKVHAGFWAGWTITVASLPAPTFGHDVIATVHKDGCDPLTVRLQYSETLPDESGYNRATGYFFEHEGMEITDAFLSSCSRFLINPEEYYGVPKVVAQLLTNLQDIARNVCRYGRNYDASQKARKTRRKAALKALEQAEGNATLSGGILTMEDGTEFDLRGLSAR